MSQEEHNHFCIRLTELTDKTCAPIWSSSMSVLSLSDIYKLQILAITDASIQAWLFDICF